MDGGARRVIEAYLGAVREGQGATSSLDNVENRRGNGKVRYRAVEFLSSEGIPQQIIRAGDPIVIRFHYFAGEPVAQPSFGFRLYTDMGTLVTDTSTWHHGIHIPQLEPGEGYLDLEIGGLNLMPAKYPISLWITDMTGASLVFDNIEHGVTLEIGPANIYQSGRELDSRSGIVFFPQRWNLAGIHGTRAEVPPELPRHAAAIPV